MASEDNAPAGAPLPDLARFRLVRVLNDEGRALYLLGDLQDKPAVLIVEAAALDAAQSRAAAFTDLKSLGVRTHLPTSPPSTRLTANSSTPSPSTSSPSPHSRLPSDPAASETATPALRRSIRCFFPRFGDYVVHGLRITPRLRLGIPLLMRA